MLKEKYPHSNKSEDELRDLEIALRIELMKKTTGKSVAKSDFETHLKALMAAFA